MRSFNRAYLFISLLFVLSLVFGFSVKAFVPGSSPVDHGSESEPHSDIDVPLDSGDHGVPPTLEPSIDHGADHNVDDQEKDTCEQYDYNSCPAGCIKECVTDCWGNESGTYCTKNCTEVGRTCLTPVDADPDFMPGHPDNTEALEPNPISSVDTTADSEVAPTPESGIVPTPVPISAAPTGDQQIIEIGIKAKNIAENKFDLILKDLSEVRDVAKEKKAKTKYLISLKHNVQKLSVEAEDKINNFIAYGVDDNTKKLGAGERAAVMHSFKSAFNKLPETETEISDAIKIANGRWPTNRSDQAESKAKTSFKLIYKRDANMDNSNDNAAVTVMAYGLRQKAKNRKLESERNGIKIFKGIYGHTPANTDEWNIMQAITYSGATR